MPRNWKGEGRLYRPGHTGVEVPRGYMESNWFRKFGNMGCRPR